MSLEQLRQEYAACTKCPELCKSRTQVVFGSGSPHSKVLLVGEAPGASEDKAGIPFCGMSGKILSELLAHIRLTCEEVFITNTLLCRPQDNRNPAPQEVENCRERLDQVIAFLKPTVIVTIGNFATERILGKTGIKSLRGRIFSVVLAGQEVKVIPVIHPANYLYSGRNPEILKQMQQDFEAIAAVIKEKKQQKSLSEY